MKSLINKKAKIFVSVVMILLAFTATPNMVQAAWKDNSSNLDFGGGDGAILPVLAIVGVVGAIWYFTRDDASERRYRTLFSHYNSVPQSGYDVFVQPFVKAYREKDGALNFIGDEHNTPDEPAVLMGVSVKF